MHLTGPQALRTAAALFIIALSATSAKAGPPFLSDDPAPTPYRHYEIYGFAAGENARDGQSGAVGVDFNYGATPDLQLTAVFPIEYQHPDGGALSGGAGNVEFAAKVLVLHQETFGWDVAVFPRLFLPSASDRFGDDHASFLLPIWLGREMGNWSTFGGGGCALHRGGDAQDYCLAGWALTRQIAPPLRLGAEMFHQSADAKDSHDITSIGAGATYDLNENLHLLGYVNAPLQRHPDMARSSWYASILFTF